MQFSKKMDPANFEFMGDLLSFDGPFLSHFVDRGGGDFLLFWAGEAGGLNQWLLFETPKKSLQAFFSKEKTLRQLALDNPNASVWLVDIDNDAVWQNAELLKADRVSTGMLPGESAFFDEKGYDFYAIELRDSLLKPRPKKAPRVLGAAVAN